MKHYDYLIVGSGLFGAVFAHEAAKHGMKCLVLEKRSHTGGNIYCAKIEDVIVHQYGAHIFHTNSKRIWEYVNDLTEFNRFTNSPIANYHGEIYNMPFNMNTFSKMWAFYSGRGKGENCTAACQDNGNSRQSGRTGDQSCR